MKIIETEERELIYKLTSEEQCMIENTTGYGMKNLLWEGLKLNAIIISKYNELVERLKIGL